MNNIMFLNNWGEAPAELLERYKRQTPGNDGVWGDIKAVLDPDDANFFVVMEGLPGNIKDGQIPKEKIIYFQREPDEIIKTFGLPDHFQGEALFRGTFKEHYNLAVWFINVPFKELASLEIPAKPKKLSAIMSSKNMTYGHRQRLKFLYDVKKLYREIDIYGHGFTREQLGDSYKGALNYNGHCKYRGLIDYEYSLAIDNVSMENMFDEKLIDCFLTWTKPVYWGCKNIDRFFPENSYVWVDIFDPDAARRVIEEIEKPVDYKALKEARELVLYKYNLWPSIERIINKYTPAAHEGHTGKIKNNKRIFAEQSDLEARISPHLLKFLSEERNVLIEETDPSEFFTYKRFDLPAKYIYAKLRDLQVDSTYGIDLYSKHLLAFNRYTEGDGTGKEGLEMFLAAFNDILDDINKDGFNPDRSAIPVSYHNNVLDGSHRLAACLYFKKPLTVYRFHFEGWHYTHVFFKKRGLSEDYCDAIAYEYCKLNKNTYLALLFPSAIGHDDEVRTILQRYGSIFYEKEVRLFNNGPLLLMTQIYKNENWLGNLSNNFGGARLKAQECFRTDLPIRVFLLETDNPKGLKDAKDEIRAIYQISNHSIHINDTYEETIRVAQLLFNGNSIHFLNHATLKALPQFQNNYRTLQNLCSGKSREDLDMLCLTGSAVMALYGLRDARDIDYFYFKDALPEDPSGALGSHNKEIHHYPATRDDIIFNPKNHFYFDGFKFASLEIIRTMKEKRGEDKDIVDIDLIGKFLETKQIDAPVKAKHELLKPITTPVVSIILLNYNGFEDIRLCIDSISRNTSEPYEIVVFDNASSDNSLSYLRSLPGIFLVESPVNLGCPAGRAQAMTYVHPASKYIIFLDNDTIVTKGWTAKFIAHTKRDRTIGIIGPRSNYVSGAQLVRNVSYSNIKELESFALQWSLQNKDVLTPTHRLIGFCMFITRDVIEKIGSIDASFGKFGFEDDDYTWRAVLAGFKAMIANDVFIHHKGGPQGQGNKAYNEAMLGAWETFKNKWGIPGEVSYGNPITFSAVLGQPFNKEKHYIPLVSKRDETSDHECEKGNVSIIILTHNQLDHTKKCVKSIFRHTPEAREIIFVDNGSTDGTLKWLKGQIHKNKTCRLIENKENPGFAKSCNQGMKTSCGEYILLLNNEVVVTDGWLSGMLECHKYEPNAGIVGPMSNHGSGPQQIIDDDYHTPDNLDKFAYNFRERYRHRRIPHRNIDGFCMLFHRTLPENIGLFDERFETGQCEEEDFCLRTALAGHRNCIAGDVFILSNGGRVFPNQGNKTVRKPFEQKWTLNAQSPDGKRLAVLKASELANDLCQRGQTDKAIEVLIDCIKISPDSADIYYELARILIESKRFSEAWEVVGSMPETIKNELKTIEVAGYAKEGLGSDDEASTYVDKMLALNDQYPAALNLNGILAYKTGENEKAAGYFRKAADADPGYGEARINLGILQWAAGKQDEGLEHLERGFILAPLISDHSSAYYTAITSLGSFAEAESTLRSARGLYPNNKNLVFLYIDDLIQQGKWGPAMLEIEDALIAFGLDEGTLNAALAVRDNLGPLQIDKTSKKVTLSLCMIVKNEERYLANCLHSVRDIVDEIIIVDTGSTDKTIDIAKVFGAQVFEFPWTGDFSAARNQSLARASGDWILVLDADEVISGIDHRRFLELIDRGNGRQPAFTITTRNYLERPGTAGWTENDGSYPQEEKGIGWFGSDKVRLFRNNSLIRFENPVHELLEASLKRAGVPIKKCDIPIHHYGRLDRDKLLAKGKDYYLLGRKKLEERGDGDYVALRELAIQAGELGIFDEAADLWQQALSVRPDDVDALFNLGYNYLQIGKYLEASHASRRAVELSPDTKDAVLNYALSEMFLGNAPKATTLLEKSLSKEEENPVLMAVLGASSLINGDNEKGLAIFKKLKEKQINPAAYMNSLLEQLVKSGQIDYFVRLIDAAISNNITDRETLRRQITPTLNKIAREFQSNGKADKALIILNASVEKKLNNEETGKLLGVLRTI